MTLEQAVQILLLCSSRAMLPKEDHVRCEQAAKLLLEHVKKNEPKKEEANKEPVDGSETSK